MIVAVAMPVRSKLFSVGLTDDKPLQTVNKHACKHRSCIISSFVLFWDFSNSSIIKFLKALLLLEKHSWSYPLVSWPINIVRERRLQTCMICICVCILLIFSRLFCQWSVNTSLCYITESIKWTLLVDLPEVHKRLSRKLGKFELIIQWLPLPYQNIRDIKPFKEKLNEVSVVSETAASLSVDCTVCEDQNKYWEVYLL